MAQNTFIHGIAACQNIDSSGEIIDIAGLDISSLEKDGVINYAHKSDAPNQILGKILKAKKIFSDADCEDEHQLFFWNFCKAPFVYIIAELFDGQNHSSAQDIAAMFRYSLENEGKHENYVLGFSIEGSKIAKEGNVVTKSIGRKVTLDPYPCHKQAIARMVPADTKKSKNNIDSLFKTEHTGEVELFKKENHQGLLMMLKNQDPSKHAKKLGIEPMTKEDGLSAGGASTALSGVGPSSPSLMGSEKQMNKAKPNLSIVKPADPRGKHLGNTVSGKAVHAGGKIAEASASGFTAADHRDAAQLHSQAGNSVKAQLHMQAAGSAEKRSKRLESGMKQKRDKTAASSVPSSKPGSDKLFDPHLSGKIKPPGPSTKKSENMTKALDAGSGLGAAPSQMTQGAALGKESLERKMKKSKWLARAEQEYANWEKREQFEQYMSQRMPQLNKGEIKAIGQVMALNKSLSKKSK